MTESEYTAAAKGLHKTRASVDDAAFEANLATIKGSVQCPEVAEAEVELKPSGRHLRGRCPLPNHQGDSPSFYCYDNGSGFYDSWHCHRCNEGGDVLDLYGKMHGLEHSLRYTMDDLSERYGIHLWRPEDFMSDNQMALRRARIRAEQVVDRAILDYVFKQQVMPVIRAMDDPVKRAEALAEALRVCGLAKLGR